MKKLALFVLPFVCSAVFAAPPNGKKNGLEFSSPQVNDLQRGAGEPIIEIDKAGVVYTCGPTGFSQNQDYAFVSLDNGDQFNPVGQYPRGQFSVGGGGDCAFATGPEPNAAGQYPFAYTGLGGLLTFTTATSDDNGATVMVANTSSIPGLDRQWNVYSSASTVFHTYNRIGAQGGYNVQRSDDGGLTYGRETLVASGSAQGQIRSMPATLNPSGNGLPVVYFPFSSGPTLKLAISFNEGDSWSTCTVAEAFGDTGNKFPIADHDEEGNLYFVYTEGGSWDTFVTTVLNAELMNCAADGMAATEPIQVNRDKVDSTAFPWIVASGKKGRVAVAFYGSELEGAPDDLALPHVWDVYVTQSINALDKKPDYYMVKASSHPMHYDQICQNGLGCTTGGDRSLVDFFAIDYNPANGELMVVYNWAHKRPGDVAGQFTSTVSVRQVAGPSHNGGKIENKERVAVRSATPDPEGDAYSDFSNLFLTGARGNTPALDVKNVEILPLAGGDGFTVRMQMADLSAAALQGALTDLPAQSLLWVFYYVDGYRYKAASARWNPAQGFSFGHNGYEGSLQECGAPPSDDPTDPLPAAAQNPAGLTGPDQCIYYRGMSALQGRVDQAAGTIELDLPLAMLTALKDVEPPARSPAEVPAQPGDRIYSAAVYTQGNLVSPTQMVQSWLTPVDNTAAMDFLIPGGKPATKVEDSTLTTATNVAGNSGKQGKGLLLGALSPLMLLPLLLGLLKNLRLPLIGLLGLALAGCGSSDPFGGIFKLASLPPVAPVTGPATAVIGPSLQVRMDAMDSDDTLEVIVTFREKKGIAKSTAASLQDMGLEGGYFKRLPVAGVIATRAQIDALARRPDVRSLWHNDVLSYDNAEARYLSSVDSAQAAPELKNANGEPITGKGVAILVNDSGIDGTHPDLMNKVVANAIGHTNLRGVAENEMLPFTPTECVGPCNSDFGGSHGSHVAGIAAGDGSASGGAYAGAAKGASLIGYGSGATLLVLDTLGGFDYALQMLDEHPEYNLRIVTNSFGSTGDQGTQFNPDDPTNVVTKILADRGLIVVFSAGNSGSGPDSITGNFKKAPWIMIAANGEKSGLLAPSSSRGTLVEPVYETEVDGEKFIVEDRPTVVTAGTNIISARAVAADPFLPLDLADDVQNPAFTPQQVPFYTLKTGTSMSAPHLAGLTALLLEANPALTWREIKPIFKTTATNMPGYDSWEVGAGFANVEAALAMALNLRNDYGKVNHLARSFNASVPIGDRVSSEERTIAFTTVGDTESVQFEVGPNIALVSAVMLFQAPCSCSVLLIDPDGKERRSSGSLPTLAPRVSATSSGKPGTWTLTVRGLRSFSGVVLDPTGMTNGASAPATVDIQLDQYAFQDAQGLKDIAGHPLQRLIENAVKERLMDGTPGGFKPDAKLTRADFAEYLMAWGLRQTRSHAGGNRFGDIPAANGLLHAAAEAVTRPGALILSKSPTSLPLLPLADNKFQPGKEVTREQVAYALVQAMGRQAQAEAHGAAPMTAPNEDGDPVAVTDSDKVDPALRGHVQEALNLKIIEAEFTDGKVNVKPTATVSRADYAVAAYMTFIATLFP